MRFFTSFSFHWWRKFLYTSMEDYVPKIRRNLSQETSWCSCSLKSRNMLVFLFSLSLWFSSSFLFFLVVFFIFFFLFHQLELVQQEFLIGNICWKNSHKTRNPILYSQLILVCQWGNQSVFLIYFMEREWYCLDSSKLALVIKMLILQPESPLL